MNKDTIIIVLIAAIVALIAWLIVVIDGAKNARCQCDMITSKPGEIIVNTRQAEKFQYDYTFDNQEIERMIYHNFYDAGTIENCMRQRVCNSMTVEMTKLIDIFDITLTKRRGPRGEEWHARGEVWILPTKK